MFTRWAPKLELGQSWCYMAILFYDSPNIRLQYSKTPTTT